jgi:hypothetical protein
MLLSTRINPALSDVINAHSTLEQFLGNAHHVLLATPRWKIFVYQTVLHTNILEYDDVFKFSSTISIDCETTRLSDISQLVEESDLYKISKFVNILEFYLTITIAKGSTCILTDSLKIGGFLDRLQNNINSIIII